MSIIENHVIADILQKNSSGQFDRYHIGPELQYVGPQINSNNNNLEEQLILGTDKEETITKQIIEEEGEEPFLRTTRIAKFKDENSESNYYILTEIIDSEIATSIDSEDEHKLIIKRTPKILNKTTTLSFYTDSAEDISVKSSDYQYDLNEDVIITDVIGLPPEPGEEEEENNGD